ncbi:MAG: hypothetical protein WBA51_16585 [Erythrobacter sp.]
MKPSQLLLAPALLAMGLAASAAACDLDGLPGMPGMGSFHRYNPFASQMSSFPAPDPLTEAQAEDDQAKTSQTKSKAVAKTKEAAKDREARLRAIEPTPPRDWERDYGNGPINPKDMATFTR